MGFSKDTYWVVGFSGGIGPDTWDSEILVQGETIRDALNEAEERLKHEDCDIDSIQYRGWSALDEEEYKQRRDHGVDNTGH